MANEKPQKKMQQMAQTDIQTDIQTDTQTWQLYDWIGQVGPIQWKSWTLNPDLFPGITTVLTMTFLGLEARKDLPKVIIIYFVFLQE